MNELTGHSFLAVFVLSLVAGFGAALGWRTLNALIDVIARGRGTA